MAADPYDDQALVPAGDFARDMEVTPDGSVEGRFRAELTDAWKIFYAFGGASMAMGLRAAERAIDRDDLRPISTTATFAAPVSCGPVIIDTDVLRSGKNGAQVTADLFAGDEIEDGRGSDLHVSAVFGTRRDTHVSFVDVEFPADALMPDDAIEPPPPPGDSPFRHLNYHDQTDFRFAHVDSTFNPDDWKPGPARALTWHRLLKEPRLTDGTLDPVALCLPADILGPAVFAKLGPPREDNPFFLVLSLEINLQFIAPTSSAWILQHVKVPVAADGYAFSYAELWDEDRQLVAVATQRAMVRPVEPSRFAQPDGTA